MIAAFVNAYKNYEAADKKENINPDRAAETGKRCRKVNENNKQSSNAPEVLNGFEAVFQSGGFGRV